MSDTVLDTGYSLEYEIEVGNLKELIIIMIPSTAADEMAR